MNRSLHKLSLFCIMLCSGIASAQTYTSNTPVTIIASDDCPGLGTPANSVINVPLNGVISTPSAVFIEMNLTAECLATVKLELVAPDGNTCILLNMPYRTGACDGDCYATSPSNPLTFNSTFAAKLPGTYPIPTGNYAPTGSTYAPAVGNLGTFLAGKAVNGNWILRGSADASSSAIINSWSITLNSVLPLDLLSFSGYASTGYNELKWSTASESNSDRFDVQRSEDQDMSFKSVGSVRAKGSGDNKYSFRDQNQLPGTYLYRLRMIDKDGTYTYSSIVRISAKTFKNAGVRLSPNPVKDVLNLTFTDKEILNTNARIVNSMGHTVISFRVSQEKMQYPLGKLAAGIYVLKLSNGDQFKFVKIN